VTAQQAYRWGRIDLDGRPLRDGATATVEDDDGVIVLTVRSRTEPQPTELASVGRVMVVAAEGDIDVDTAPLLWHVLGNALDCRQAVCFDVSGVTFFGAAAARLLLAMHRRAAETGQLFFIRGARAMAEHVLDVVDPYQVIARH
jgi:anti-anti-sigma factor